MSYSTIETIVDGMVGRVALNRPEVRNAFNETAIEEITRAFHELSGNAAIRAIVLAANGPAFCAGADLNWMKKMAGYTYEENLADAARLADMLKAIDACPVPVVACVQGDCYAGGMGLAAACDIVIASETANFCLSEVKLGLIPATISPYVIKGLGVRAAQRYFLTAERFTAAQAEALGFVHECVPHSELETTVDQILNALLGASPNAVRAAKQLVKDVAGAPITDALIAGTVRGIAEIRASDEGKEGVQAFLERRKAAWLQ